jgi:hypothetical protein
LWTSQLHCNNFPWRNSQSRKQHENLQEKNNELLGLWFRHSPEPNSRALPAFVSSESELPLVDIIPHVLEISRQL